MQPFKQILLIPLVMLAWLGIVFMPSSLLAQEIIPVATGPVHEAFLSPITDMTMLDAVNIEPPPPIVETIPIQTDSLAVWISGYWAWSRESNQMIWVSGVWRRPPPGRYWNSGYWQLFPEGWVYLKGFWAPSLESNLAYISVAPKDAMVETISPSPSNNYFWSPGYWFYALNEGDYVWIAGEWKELNPNWILTPAHYIWRPEGYIFVSPYWDWPLEVRGTAYSNIEIAAEVLQRRRSIVYNPSQPLDMKNLVGKLIVNYPDYLYFFRHYYYFHPDLGNQDFIPPWWNWPTWWALNWQDQWALWWWYTHPGYPQPYWMNETISSQLPPPQQNLLIQMRNINFPAIITSERVVTPQTILTSAKRFQQKFPILSSQVRAQMGQTLREGQEKPLDILQPRGNFSTFKQNFASQAPQIHFKDVQPVDGSIKPKLQLPSLPTEASLQQWRTNWDRERENVQQKLNRVNRQTTHQQIEQERRLGEQQFRGQEQLQPTGVNWQQQEGELERIRRQQKEQIQQQLQQGYIIQ